MTSKLKCPFCQTELEDAGIHSPELYFWCRNCYMKQKEKDDNYTASPIIWQALTQAKQDLDFFIKEQVRTHTALIERTKELDKCQKDLKIATKALEEYADEDMWENCCKWDIEYMQGLFLEHGYEIAKEALEQIEQKEERNESIRSNTDD